MGSAALSEAAKSIRDWSITEGRAAQVPSKSVEAYASLVVSPAQAVIVSFVVLILTLLFRPTGLFVPTPK